MDGARISTTVPQRSSRGFFSVLASAISEWCLMILLFLNALLGHVAAKLANSCKLPPPCGLCSRLDRILGRGFCFDSLCHSHKLEISTLAFCPNHRRLAAVRDMCEACLDAHKLFVGMTESVDKAPLLVDSDSSRAGRCSCCSRRIRRKNHPHELMKAKESGGNVANLTAQADGMFKKNKKSPIGYQKLSITLDSDSEVPCSDDDVEASQAGVIEDRRGESKSAPLKVRKVKKVPTIVIAEDTVPEKLIHPTSVDPKRQLLDTQSDITSEETYKKYSSFEEINGTSVIVKNYPVSEYPSRESSVAKSIALNGDMNYPPTSDMNYPPMSSDTEVTKELSSTNMPSYIMNDPKLAAQLANDNFKLSLYHKGSVQSPRFSDIVAAKEPSRVQEDLMIKLASISSSKGIELPWNDPTSSPKEQVLGDKAKSLYPFSPVSSRQYTKRFSIERNSSSIEPFEGEMTVENLKQQLEVDRKSMTALYKELDEERNASAIAASEAMAMINRLQEEKASMQMEALQYLRMMEEQSEYDQEAIQRLNDLLTDREKELLDLESKLENYRQNYEDNLAEEKVIEPLGQQSKAGSAHNPLFGFEEEKSDILKCLRKLQEELCVNNHQDDDVEKPSLVNVNGQDQNGVKQESRLRSDSVGNTKKVSSLQAELQNLSMRLEALEGDGRFLELSANILRNGNDGRQFIQEIACQLHELRRIQAAQRG